MADMRPPRREYNLCFPFILGEEIEAAAMTALLGTAVEAVAMAIDIAEVAVVEVDLALEVAAMAAHTIRQVVAIVVDAVIQVAPVLAVVREADVIRILEIIDLFVILLFVSSQDGAL